MNHSGSYAPIGIKEYLGDPNLSLVVIKSLEYPVSPA